MIQDLFPEDRRCAVPPQAWGSDYHRSLLAGVRLNAVAEMPATSIIASTDFKSIVTGDLVMARAPHKPSFNFRPLAGHLFSANELPATTDQSRGFWRRFIVVRFNNTFAVPGDPTAPANAKSAVDGEKLMADLRKEREGIMAWALEGAVRLLAQGRYTLPPSHAHELERWRRGADQVAEFVDTACEKTVLPTGTSGAHLYRMYRMWAARSGHASPLTTVKFGVRLKKLVAWKKENQGMKYAVAVKDSEKWDDPDV